MRDVILQVNRTYIRSAAQADSYRTEPPFKLQGSYRNMNRIAERVVPVMNNQELATLVFSNYEQDAQTLTRDGESNLLKFKELLGVLSADEQKRWNSIKYAFVETVRMQGMEGEDSAAQLLRSLSGLRDGLESIRRTISDAVETREGETDRSEQFLASLTAIKCGLEELGEQLTSSMRTRGENEDSGDVKLPEQKVLVQHSVPRVMTDLIESQFQLLYDGLRPILEQAAVSQNQLDAVKRSIDSCLNNYRTIQEEIRSAKGK